MPSTITTKKSTTQNNDDFLNKQEKSIQTIFQDLERKDFDSKQTFIKLIEYIKGNNRILYSTISNIIYAIYENAQNDRSNSSETILAHLGDLLTYSNNIDKKTFDKKISEDDISNAKTSVIKIWDHVNLAIQQYTILKQSDKEYDEKFKSHIVEFKEKMQKEIIAQMITMVSIFTALAFLIFGSISFLDNIFENGNQPLLRIMSVGLIWGLCVSNMIFMFLSCAGKLSNMSICSDNAPSAPFSKKYPIVFWTNFVLLVLLLTLLFFYFLQTAGIYSYLQTLINNPLSVLILTIVFLLFFGIFLHKLFVKLQK